MSKKKRFFAADSEEGETASEEPLEEHQGIKSIASQVGSKAATLVLAGIVAGILIGQLAMPGLGVGFIALPVAGNDSENQPQAVDTAKLKADVQSYINTNFLEAQGFEAEVTGLEPYNDSLFKVLFDVKKDGELQAEDQEIYLTKDGLTMIPGQIFNLSEPVEQPAQTEPPVVEVPKSDKPTVELFVMSYCPYGLQSQKALLPAWKLLGEKADFSVKFVDYIMHGLNEIEENNVQYCIQKEQAGKYVAYAECFAQSGDSAACLASAGIDKAKLDSCVAATDKEFGIMAAYNDKSTWQLYNGEPTFPIYMVDSVLNQVYGVGGSPTWVINGTVVSVSRNPEAVKQAVCGAFNVAPAECSQVLSSTPASSGFGGGTGTADDAGCAT